VGALSDPKVVEYLNDNYICTYLKVGTFRIVRGAKVGGNVASYFCLWDGAVVHAVPGKVDAGTLLSEARWAVEVRKSALTAATDLRTGKLDRAQYTAKMVQAHVERFDRPGGAWRNAMPQPAVAWGTQAGPLPPRLPADRDQQAQANWLLARYPLASLNMIYPMVWREILHEQLSDVPVATQ
jgi:hypothetical protein